MNARAEFASSEHDIAALRVPPHSIEAESSVLGALLLNNAAWDRVSDILLETDFYRHEHRLIFAAIGILLNSNKGADVVTVFGYLQNQGTVDDADGLVYLNDLAQYVPSAANIRRYAEIVRERSVMRKLITTSDEIASAAFNPQGATVEQMLDKAQGQLLAISESRRAGSLDEWTAMDDGVVKVMDRIQHLMDGGQDEVIATGLEELDIRLDGGMRPGDFIVIGARSGHGKSALSKTIGSNVAKAGHAVGEFSMEMAEAKQRKRILSGISGVHLSKLNHPERLNDFEWTRISNATDAMRKMHYDINDQGGMTIDQIRARARSLHRKRGKLGLIIVDHLQLLKGSDPKAPRTYQLAEGSRGLKSLAKELGCAVIGLAQINRTVDKEVDPMPRVSDLSDSGSIEQDADVIVLFDRPFRRKPDLGPEWKNYTRAHMAKVRDGEPGYLNLFFEGEYTRFSSWPATLEVPTKLVRSARGREL
ncbi:MAG: replicative DNA helicase [Rhodoferax sp.]|uniref:replicative DNA helicase n=1 Tax=Rhodoferax sp. TaxID=50421 RepID=UPI002ACE9BDE|nr:replicative DNA helicase [Rhodoferax sp.]MDZ7892351.1 replicative DNA helicase [Rhodoferax sp.]